MLAGPWESLSTEARHHESADLDTLSTRAAVELTLREDARGIGAALARSEEIARAAEWFAETLEGGGDVLLAGAGTSGRLAVLEAAELPPTFGTDPERVRAAIAGGPEAIFRAAEGAEDREEDGRAAASALRRQDLLIAVSASSVTPFARGALAAAHQRGARTVLLTCTGIGAAEAAAAAVAETGAAAHLTIALDTGAEILTGSTRLKAGSATKAALNAITTAAMLELGKVFENLMVDLKTGSAKLRDRAVRIVAAAGRVERDEAARLLAACDGEVKTAIVAARRGVAPAAARATLERAAGRVRAALQA